MRGCRMMYGRKYGDIDGRIDDKIDGGIYTWIYGGMRKVKNLMRLSL
jgi:hypothetical protein